MNKDIIFIAEMLTEPSKGVYTQWVYYDDGTMDTNKISKGLVVVTIPIVADYYLDIHRSEDLPKGTYF
jgi:hypothetical protein